jgi:single-stranded DNA-binding protein
VPGLYEGVNEVRLLGKVCFTPKLKQAHNYKFLRTILVVKEDRGIFGESKRLKTYHPITMLNDLAEEMNGQLERGMLVYLIGRLNHYFLEETKRMTDVLVQKVHIVSKNNPEDEEEREPFKEVDEEWLEEFDNVVPIFKYRFYINEDPDVPF